MSEINPISFLEMISSSNHNPILILLLTIVFISVLSPNVFVKSTNMYPFSCTEINQTCNSYLYHISQGYSIRRIAYYYRVNASNVKSISHGSKQGYLVSVPCNCKVVNGTSGYFYETSYKIRPNDTFFDDSSKFYSGQAWQLGGKRIVPGKRIRIYLICGCVEVESQEVVTYTVQEHDTLSGIAELLSSEISGIQNLNTILAKNPSYIDVGWVLFVPMDKNRNQAPRKVVKPSKRHNLTIIVSLLSAAALFAIFALIFFLLRRKRRLKSRDEDPKAVTEIKSAKKITLQQQNHKRDIEATIESERAVVYSLVEVNEATSNFNDSRKIGEGGYGSVYVGILREKEVAIKKMKSSSSREFFAELKILCKIHHINVVELLGYATGENHLYLIYEYIQNGSLDDHLHGPLLKGHMPLSWIARAQIALDTARGIEYIHDHTKARYVHRDIKTSNILLDQGLRAKVADFGLARLVERSNEEDYAATRLVGTPGYIAPESVRELQMTSKTDVFAFGVVLAELITGQPAVSRDNKEPTIMRSLVLEMKSAFGDQDSETSMEVIIDPNLKGSYPTELVYKMAELSRRCLNEAAVNRPEMQEIVQVLSQILMSSTEWEASLGGVSQVFTGLSNGR